jgi:hypothetical protein
MRKYWLVILLLLSVSVHAQDSSIFMYPIKMDEVVIKEARGGWDVQGFIRRVQNDTTFYKAFKSMRVVSYTANNDIRVYNKKSKVQASLNSTTRQNAAKGCRSMDVLNEKVTGDFYKKNKDYRYYTAELYAYLFFTKGTLCNQSDIVADALNEREEGQIGKQKYRLKQLIFNPGSKVAVYLLWVIKPQFLSRMWLRCTILNCPLRNMMAKSVMYSKLYLSLSIKMM